ncbi:MAG: site-specific DNA-methyltransferase [Lachnospiraceae bacterium]|nr:site-specific DNA-methyltransferase [Lachnospiraceae bacterium]
MDKMKMESVDIRQKNIDKIAELFPGAITEKLDEKESTIDKKVYKKAVNFDLLRQLLSEEEIAGDEAYEFTWVGKNKAIVEANTPIRKTLRPCKEESNSREWDTTENLYIEGDNLEVLKLLQESYLGKIKLIYIDPPYNTGNDFIYRDDFKQSIDDYEENMGVYDDDENRLFKNTDTNGRFHSDWCSMMYSRLILAKNSLSNEGVMFISIDEHEVETLTKIADEVFGFENHIGTIVVKSNPRGSMSTSEIASLHEYLLVYSKNRSDVQIIGHELSEEMTSEYKYIDENGNYRLLGLRMRGGFWRRSERPNLYYPIYINPNDGTISLNKDNVYIEEAIPIQPSTMEDGTWRWSKDKVIQDKHLLIGKAITRNDNIVWDIYQKDYLNRNNGRRTKAKSIWDENEINYQNGTTEIKNLLGNSGIFDYSKPVFLILKAMKMISFKDGDIVLDFFSGSATTAHAVMQLNAEDKCKRSFIMVQLPQKIDENTEAYRNGFKNICEIGKERIRRAGDKILSENSNAKNLDIGFRVFKVDDSNMKDVYYAAGDYNQNILDMIESNIKEDRTDLDLLFSCILEWGMPLSLPYVEEDIDGVKIHNVADGDLIACFEENINEEVIKKIASREQKPLRVVFRDRSFVNSPAKINVEEIFKLLSPNTKIKVL